MQSVSLEIRYVMSVQSCLNLLLSLALHFGFLGAQPHWCGPLAWGTGAGGGLSRAGPLQRNGRCGSGCQHHGSTGRAGQTMETREQECVFSDQAVFTSLAWTQRGLYAVLFLLTLTWETHPMPLCCSFQPQSLVMPDAGQCCYITVVHS